jgi:hypothetical protein
MSTSIPDRILSNMKTVLENAYWMNPTEGIFNFQFLNDDKPFTNTLAPLYFQLMRYTPDITSYLAFQTSQQGIVLNNGLIQYGGSSALEFDRSTARTGQLQQDGSIRWNDGSIWRRVANMPTAKTDLLDLNDIQHQAKLDSVTLQDVVSRNYYY